MIKNTYGDGHVVIMNDEVSINLYPSQRITYSHWISDEDGWFTDVDYEFDLLADVGELWLNKILEIIEDFEIKIAKYETPGIYRDMWISYNKDVHLV